MSENTEFKKFDNTMQKILSVSHKELQKREAEWKRRKAEQKTNEKGK
jgi:hypothetical protein